MRIEFPGAVYHITSRGNERRDIFRDDDDRRHFLELLGEVVRRFAEMRRWGQNFGLRVGLRFPSPLYCS